LAQAGRPDYIQAVTEEPEDGGYLFDGQPVGEDDAETQLYRKAVQVVAESQKASVSYLQRQLRVGYNSAARLIERMEKDGLVGHPRPRRPPRSADRHRGARDLSLAEPRELAGSGGIQWGEAIHRANSSRRFACCRSPFRARALVQPVALIALAGRAGVAVERPARGGDHLAADPEPGDRRFHPDRRQGPPAGRARCRSSARARSASNMAAGPTCCWSAMARR
jgi:hypothetical protein